MEFNPEKINLNTEKQNLWNSKFKEVEMITDRLGKRIDSNIKESVVAFSALGFNTSGSCEGHLDRGLPYPWIDIDAFDKKDFLEFTKIKERVEEKKYPNEQSAKKDDPELYEKIIQIQQKFSNQRKEVEQKIDTLLKEFYLSHKSYLAGGDIMAERFGRGFRIQTSLSRGLGLDNWKKFDERMNKLSVEEKNKFLENNQKEMADFTVFLKNKFFE
ncbi:MAG: hypothetical protein WC059_03255 [Candidatus Paceibacterota bacterium]